MSEQVHVHHPDDFSGLVPPQRIMGIENEYELFDTQSVNPTNAETINSLICAENLAAIGLKRAIYQISNGAKLHKDISVAEYGTPECNGAAEMVAFQELGKRVMFLLTENLNKLHPVPKGKPKRFELYLRGGNLNDLSGKPSMFKSNGNHLNLLVPPDSVKNAYDLIASFLATSPLMLGSGMAWTGYGNNNFYRFSQKAQDVGQVDGKSRTAPRDKGMVRSHHTNDYDGAGSAAWPRLEVLCLDPFQGPWARLMGAATVSLVARLAEHKDRLSDMECLHLFKPDRVIKDVSADIGLHNVYYDRYQRKTISALDHTGLFAEKSSQLISEVELSEAERWAVGEWLKIRDDLERWRDSGRPFERDNSIINNRVVHAARLTKIQELLDKKHLMNDKRGPKRLVNRADPLVYKFDTLWDRVYPEGLGDRWWSEHIYPGVPLDFEFMQNAPVTSAPNTRGSWRAKIISMHSAKISEATWKKIALTNGHEFINDDPYSPVVIKS